MKSVLAPLLLAFGVLTVGQTPPPRQEAVPAKSAARAAFDALKNLAGTWSGTVKTNPPNPEIDGPIQVTMRVASGGSALVHEMSPGGVPEPTMIFLDADRLTLVHYCEAGNRPRLVARESPDRKSVEFDFVDISGSREPAYLDHLLFTIADPDDHTEDWTFRLAGGGPLRAHFELKRAKGGGPR